MNTQKYKIKLEEEKKLLEEELGGLGKVDKNGEWKAVPESKTRTQEVQDTADITERAEDFEERSSEVDILDIRLEDIKKSLREIEEGKYGFCEKCGKEIGEDRLDANPASHTCKSCMNE